MNRSQCLFVPWFCASFCSYVLCFLSLSICRELSLYKKNDSPFALLAKENGILWSGGMPDDCAVVCLRVMSTQHELEK